MTVFFAEGSYRLLEAREGQAKLSGVLMLLNAEGGEAFTLPENIQELPNRPCPPLTSAEYSCTRRMLISLFRKLLYIQILHIAFLREACLVSYAKANDISSP